MEAAEQVAENQYKEMIFASVSAAHNLALIAIACELRAIRIRHQYMSGRRR